MAAGVPDLSAFVSPEQLHWLNEAIPALSSPTTTKEARMEISDELNIRWNLNTPDALIAGLLTLLYHPDEAIRKGAAVCLHHAITKNPASMSREPVPKTEKQAFQLAIERISGNLLQILASELLKGLTTQTKLVRRDISFAIAELALFLDDKQQAWPDLFPSLLSCFQSPEAEIVAMGYDILAKTSYIFEENLPQYLATLQELFVKGLQSPSPEVRVEAFVCFFSFLHNVDSQPAAKNAFTPLIPMYFDLIDNLHTSSVDDDILIRCLSELIDFFEMDEEDKTNVKIVKSALPNLYNPVFRIINNGKTDDSVRRVALEVLVTLSTIASSTMRKQPNFLDTLIPSILNLMGSFEDSEEWYQEIGSDNDDDENNRVAGEVAFSRLACSMRSMILPTCFQYFMGMLQGANWKEHCAALMAIAAIAEGCETDLKSNLKVLLTTVAQYARSEHARVRFCACHCLGQLCTDLAPEAENKYHDIIVPALSHCLADPQPRVQAHAAAALVNFSDEASSDDMAPYLDEVMNKLIVLANHPNVEVQMQILKTIAQIGDACGDKFKLYYAPVIQFSMHKLYNSNNDRRLMSRAIECASLVICSVGKETFNPDKEAFVNVLKELQALPAEADDPLSGNLMIAWTRVCDVLREDFVPYLDIVMPPLLKNAQIEAEYVTYDAEDYDAEEEAKKPSWDFYQVHGRVIGINTGSLEDKATAIRMLVCYARFLGKHFVNYVDAVLSVVVPLLGFKMSDHVREAAATCIAPCIDSLKGAQEVALASAKWPTILASFFDAINTETNMETLQVLLEGLTASIDSMGINSMDANQLQFISNTLKSKLTDSCERIVRRAKEREDEDHDHLAEEQIQEETEMEKAVFSELGSLFKAVMETHRQNFLSMFVQDLLEIFRQLLTQKDTIHFAICAFDDIIEFTGPISWNLHGVFLDPMIKAVLDPDMSIRQAAAYGVGMMAQHGGQPYADTCAKVVPVLFNSLSTLNINSDDDAVFYVYDNLVSSLFKIYRFQQASIPNAGDLLTQALGLLPLRIDEDEAEFILTYLLELIDSGHPIFASNDGLFKLTDVTMFTLKKKLVTHDLAVRLAHLLSSISESKGQLLEAVKPGILNDVRALLESMKNYTSE